MALARSLGKPQGPGDIYSEEYALHRQLENYEARCAEVSNLRRLDGRRPADELAAVVTQWVAEVYCQIEFAAAVIDHPLPVYLT